MMRFSRTSPLALATLLLAALPIISGCDISEVQEVYLCAKVLDAKGVLGPLFGKSARYRAEIGSANNLRVLEGEATLDSNGHGCARVFHYTWSRAQGANEHTIAHIKSYKLRSLIAIVNGTPINGHLLNATLGSTDQRNDTVTLNAEFNVDTASQASAETPLLAAALSPDKVLAESAGSAHPNQKINESSGVKALGSTDATVAAAIGKFTMRIVRKIF